MAKLTELELKFKKYIPLEVDYAFQKSVSYSQFSTFLNCPHQWYLTSVKKERPYQASIHTIFGTAFHETFQHYIKTMYEVSGTAADKLDLKELFTETFRNVYSEEFKKMGSHFTNAAEMGEFFDDGIAILKWIQSRRNKLFTLRKRVLLGIEVPLVQPVANNIFLTGFIDFVLYDLELDKIYIYDIKTSTRGWKDKDKKDDKKTSQVILYKEYFAKQFGVDVDNIEVEFIIVKRKIWEESEYPIPRVQFFKPASGKNKRNKTEDSFRRFIAECFDGNGKHIEKQHLKIVGEDSCKWCFFKDKPELCNKINDVS